MIVRIWHGFTTPENADTYEQLLKTEIFPGIAGKKVSGYRGIKLLRRQHTHEVEFITLMEFENLQSVIDFAGQNYEKAYVPDKARKILSRFDEESKHYEIREEVTV